MKPEHLAVPKIACLELLILLSVIVERVQGEIRYLVREIDSVIAPMQEAFVDAVLLVVRQSLDVAG